ncbi:hypothetical protein AAZX31_15G180800 [Glycine max]
MRDRIWKLLCDGNERLTLPLRVLILALVLLLSRISSGAVTTRNTKVQQFMLGEEE